MAHGRLGLYLILLLSSVLVKSATDPGARARTKPGHGVRWKLGKFGSCSVACGGGVQTRRLRCVRRSLWRRRSFDRMVSAYLCPRPAPPVSRGCNTHRCSAHWVKDDWSECSSTCGIGTQTRDVRCESSIWSGPSVQVSRADCGTTAPVTSRRCHVVDCRYDDLSEGEGHTIEQEDYTLIQLRRTKRLTVNVGGTVKLLPGQTVEVKCPVSHSNKKFVMWSKRDRFISPLRSGRVRAKLGGLLIRKANPKTDQGVYTCEALDQRARVKVTFVQKDDPDRRKYRHFQKHFTRQQQALQTTKGSHQGPRRSDVTVPSRLQGDQSYNSTRTLTYIPGQWSVCTATCSRAGQRKRDVACAHVTTKYVKIVADEKCRERGLSRPRDVESCSPAHDCAVWRPGPWSPCHPGCGRVGFKTRYLICEWKLSGKPAFTSCDDTKRPVTRKPCKTAACPNECDDSSRSCSLARLLNMCRYTSFRRQCCHTCHKHENLTV